MSGASLPLEVAYELALSIGNTTDLAAGLREALQTYLKKLNCGAGAVFGVPPGGDDHEPPSLLEAIPRPSAIARNRGYRAALDNPGWEAASLPSTHSAEGGYYIHWFELPEFGWMLLICRGAPLEPAVLSSLADINAKLTVWARACRQNAEHLHESRLVLRNVLDTVPVRVYWKDRRLRYLGCNLPFARDAGVEEPRGIVGHNDHSLSWASRAEAIRCTDREVLENNASLLGREERLLRPDGSDCWLRTSKVPLRSENGSVLGLLGTYEDITEERRVRERLEKELCEKESLLREVHHRVFNNLSVVSAILNLQADWIHSPEQAVDAFRNTRDRVDAMAMVHQRIYQTAEYSAVDMALYCREISDRLASVHLTGRNIRIQQDVSLHGLELERAIPCALILNELLVNAMRHAFPNADEGCITVELHHLDNDDRLVQLRVADNGTGIPPEQDLQTTKTLGLQFVAILTDQLGGTVTHDNSAGTVVQVRFPH